MYVTARRFRLRNLFAVLTGSAVVLGVSAKFPHEPLIAALQHTPILLIGTAVLAVLPLICINLLCVLFQRCTRSRCERIAIQGPLNIGAPQRILLQVGETEAPAVLLGAVLAVTSTCVIALFWPVLREAGLSAAIATSRGMTQGWSALSAIPKQLTDSSFLWRLSRWELFSIFRWWLFYGALATAWLAIIRPLRNRFNFESQSQCYCRLLAFGPWLVVLEVAFVVGVWTKFAFIVPEPSSIFPVGIFSWSLWHWDCWRDADWINRGFVPSFVVSTIFFRYVLRWKWLPAVTGAACSAPVTLLLSIAWSVGYLNWGVAKFFQ